MTNLHTMLRRLDRLDVTGGHVSFGEALEAAHIRERARGDAWRAAGNMGEPPPKPPTPIEPWSGQATRAEAILWARLAHGRARVAHVRSGQASPFRDFAHIYDMSDSDLVRAVNQAEQIAHQARLNAWHAERSARA